MASKISFFPMDNEEQGGDVENVVIKVKYEEILRRFTVYVYRLLMIIDYDMNKLKTKISSLFSFSEDAVLVLTYTDEDGDVVALDNDDELRDAVLNQKLNPLRITVQLKPDSTDGSHSKPNGARTYVNNSDIRSDAASPSQSKFAGLAAEINSTIKNSLRPIPDPIRGVLTNLSRDVIRTASTAPGLSELLLQLSKMQLTNVSQSSQDPIGKPVDTSCGSSSRVTDLNTCDEPKVSNNLQNKSPRVMPQPNLDGQIPVDVDLNMSKKQKDTRAGNCIFEDFDKPNPFVDSMFMHGNSSATGQFPFGFTPQGDAIGNRHAASTSIPCSNMRPSDVITRCPMFFPPNVDSCCKGNVLGNMHGAPMLHPYRRSSSSHDHTSRTFHRGVICDGCGMHPIMGPRYKSTVKENFDLCSTCFRHMGKETEYTRIDWSAFRFPKPKKDHQKHKHRNRFLWAIESHNRMMKVPGPKLWSCFVRDVTVWDGTVMRPLSRFTKIWRIRNNGSIAWPSGTHLVWVRGDRLGGQSPAELEIPEMGFPVNEELDIAVDFLAPSVPGQHTSYWRMISPSGQKFGEEVWVLIQVKDQPSASSSIDAPAFLNLNLPPEIGNQRDEVMYTNPVDSNPSESDENKFLEEMLKPLDSDMMKTLESDILNSTRQHNGILLRQSSSDSLTSSLVVPPDVQESSPQSLNPVDFSMLNFNDQDGITVPSQPSAPSADILASSFIGSSTLPTSSTPVTNAVIDIPDPLPPIAYPLIDINYSSNSPNINYLPDINYSSNPPNINYLPSDVLTEENSVEQTLLRELEEMGFKQIDLNKEILRQNHYDLEQSVEDLCGFDEWDPLLKELQEMGFNNRELNKKLLSKNGGSIKRAVMELITGDE